MRRAAWLVLLLLAGGCGNGEEGRVYRMTASSMEPTLHCARPGVGCLAREADELFVRFYGDDEPERGDIVAFETPPLARERCGAGGVYVKRVVGLPGESWSERRGFILIDGVRLAEPYVPADFRDEASYRGGPIPVNRYFLLGDNRTQSCDSRVWGLVPRANIVGRLVEVKRGSERIHFR
jgi:signal peptidase I